MSKILKAVHRSAEELHAAGHMDDITMREFDALSLPQCVITRQQTSGESVHQPGPARGFSRRS